MFCKKCGKEAGTDAKFCQFCGTNMESQEKIDTVSTDTGVDHPAKDGETQSSFFTSEVSAVPSDQSKTFLGGDHHPWRRFFARTIDVLILGLLLTFVFMMLIAALFPNNVDKFMSLYDNMIIAGILVYLLWLPVEAAFLTALGTTPSKWIFGISVLSSDGQKLPYSDALKRTAHVWFAGEGLGIPLITLFTRIAAYRHLTKTGTTSWDEAANSLVTHKKWGFFRATSCVIITFLTLVFMSILNKM